MKISDDAAEKRDEAVTKPRLRCAKSQPKLAATTGSDELRKPPL